MGVDAQTLAIAKAYTRKYFDEHGGEAVAFDEKTIIKDVDNNRCTAVGGYSTQQTELFLVGECSINTAESLADNIRKIDVDHEYIEYFKKDYRVIGNAAILSEYHEIEDTIKQKTLVSLDGNEYSGLAFSIGKFTISGELTEMFIAFIDNSIYIYVENNSITTIRGPVVSLEAEFEAVSHIDGKFIKVDEDTIELDESGALHAKNTGSVAFDDKTINKNSDGQLQTSIGGYVVDGTYSALFEDAEPEALNIYAVKYQQSVTMVSGKTYKINISLDGNVIEYVGTCENKDLTFDGTTINTNCVLIPRELTGFTDYDIYIGSFALDTFNGVGLLFYGSDTHISIGSDDKLTLSEQTAAPEVHYLDGRVIPVDENTINLNTNNKLCAKDIEANYLNSATATSEKLTIKDKNGAEVVYQPTVVAPMNYGGTVDSWDNLPTTGLTNGLVYLHDTEGTQKIYNATTNKWDGPVAAIITIDSAMDDSSVNPVQNKKVKEYVDGISDNKTIVRNNEKLSVPIDLNTIRINSEGKIYAVFPVAQVDEHTIITKDGVTQTQIGGYYKAPFSGYIMQWTGNVGYGSRTYGTKLDLIPGETVRIEISQNWKGMSSNSWSGNKVVNADGSISSISVSIYSWTSDFYNTSYSVDKNGYAHTYNGETNGIDYTFKIKVNRPEVVEYINPKVVPVDKKTLFLNSDSMIQANIDNSTIYYDEEAKVLKAKQPTFKGMSLATIQDDGTGTFKAYRTNGDQFTFAEMAQEIGNETMVIAVLGCDVFIPNYVDFGSEIEFSHYNTTAMSNDFITVNSSNEITLTHEELIYVPKPNEEDEGKTLKVVSGVPTWS